jgi:hypothetical protein
VLQPCVRWRCPQCGVRFDKPKDWPWDADPGHRPYCPYCLLDQVRIVPLEQQPPSPEGQP